MGWAVKATPRPLFLRERDPVPIVQEAGVGGDRSGHVRKIPSFTRIRSPGRPARYTDYAIQAITLTLWNIKTKPV